MVLSQFIPVGYEHPATTVNGQSLKYYWKVKSTGFTGISTNVKHTFVYAGADATATENANYIPSVFNWTNNSWNNGLHANVDVVTNTITDWTAPANSKNFLDGDYTAGDNTTVGPPAGAFGTV